MGAIRVWLRSRIFLEMGLNSKTKQTCGLNLLTHVAGDEVGWALKSKQNGLSREKPGQEFNLEESFVFRREIKL